MDKTQILHREQLKRVISILIQLHPDGKVRWRSVKNTRTHVHVTMSVAMWRDIWEPSDSERFLDNAVATLTQLRANAIETGKLRGAA